MPQTSLNKEAVTGEEKQAIEAFDCSLFSSHAASWQRCSSRQQPDEVTAEKSDHQDYL